MVTYHKLPRLHGFEGNIYGTPSFTCTIPSLEESSVWASDSSTQWLIVVTLICVRLHESLFKTIVTGISPQVHFHFRFGDTMTLFQVKQSFCSQYATMLQQFCKYILHWMRIWAFARKWLVIFPELGLRWLSRVLTSIYAIVAIGTVTLLPPPVVVISVKKSPLQKGNPWK